MLCLTRGAAHAHGRSDASSPWPAAAAAAQERWIVVETPHFRVYAHERVASLAPEVARLCEQAHALLAPWLPLAAHRRTDVVLVDDIDTANGSARVVPTRLMRLHAYPPEPDGVLGDVDHWLWGLIVHEYVHILHLDSTSAPLAWLNLPGRKVVAPNAQQPRWFVEGLATWQESERSGGGRMRSSLFEMMFRQALLEGQVPPLDRLSGVPVTWPYATGWYLFGSRFVGWLGEREGPEALAAFIASYGRRVLPYGMNLLAAQHLGGTFEALWETWRLESEERAQRWLAGREAEGLVEGEPWTRGGQRTRRVAVAAQTGRVAWVEDTGRGPVALRWEDPDGASGRWRLPRHGEFALAPDGRTALFSLPGTVRRAWSWRDLWTLDLDSGRWRQLTYGARARDPAFGPDGTWAVFTRAEPGRMDLWRMDLATGDQELLWEAEPWGQITRPHVLPGGDVVFSYLRVDQGRSLFRLTPGATVVTSLLETRSHAIDPAWDPITERLLFSADFDGVFDVYAKDLESGEVSRVTRERAGAFAPVVVPARRGEGGGEATLLYVGYRAAGYDLFHLRWPRADAQEAVEPGAASRPVVQRLAAPEVVERVRGHRGLGELQVWHWTPQTQWGAGLEPRFGAVIQMEDPPSRYRAQADWSWEVEQETWTGSVELHLRAWPLQPFVSGTRRLAPRPRSFFVDGAWAPATELQEGFGLGVSFPFRHEDASHTLSLSYRHGWSTWWRTPDRLGGPAAPAPVFGSLGRRGLVTLGWTYARVSAYTESFSLQRGHVLSAGLRAQSRGLGGTYEALDGSAMWRAYATMPWAPMHVVALRLQGGIGVNEAAGSALYRLGGPAPQDLLEALVELSPVGQQPLRGYPVAVQAGNRFYAGTVEYRVPLLRVDRGLGTLPVHMGRWHGALFVDAGEARGDLLAPRRPLVSLGAELRLSTTVGYVQPVGFRLGFAEALTEVPGRGVYLVYGSMF